MILLIHGVAQQKHSPDGLHKRWREHLRRAFGQLGIELESDKRLTTVMAYYADLTDPQRPIGEVQRPGYERFHAELRAEIAQAPKQAWYHNSVSREVLQGIDRFSLLERTVGTQLLRMVSQEAVTYLENSDIRLAVHGRVKESIQQNDIEVVIGHSLGSVVAYDMIVSGAIRTKALLTLGSPLGSNAFRRRMSICPSTRIDGFDTLSDIRDPLDLVCFQPVMPAELFSAYAGSPTFSQDEVDNTTDNKHSIQGYLALRVAAERIAGNLR